MRGLRPGPKPASAEKNNSQTKSCGRTSRRQVDGTEDILALPNRDVRFADRAGLQARLAERPPRLSVGARNETSWLAVEPRAVT